MFVSAPVVALPLAARLPLHAPDAVQLVEPVVLQVSVVAPPLLTVAGLAANESVGAWVLLPTLTTTERLVRIELILQESEYVLVRVGWTIREPELYL